MSSQSSSAASLGFAAPMVSTIADLRRSSTTAFRAAREGALVFERTPNSFVEFRERTIHHWCELAPVLNAAYDRLDAPTPASPSR